MRYLITFSYDGSKFNGYQKQPNTKTVQQEIENALKKINSNNEVKIYASGRTDALVHAYNQKAHFDLNINISPEKLKKSLNSLISDYIYIKSVEEVSSDFHARFSVKSKEYMYIINMGEYNPIEKDYVYQYNKNLDTKAINEAIKYFIGTHDFRAFTKVELEKDFVRTIIDAKVKLEDSKIIISFIGTGFLRYQVRNMVGLLIEVGSHKKNVEDVVKILELRNRTNYTLTAKGCGLYLVDVLYK